MRLTPLRTASMAPPMAFWMPFLRPLMMLRPALMSQEAAPEKKPVMRLLMLRTALMVLLIPLRTPETMPFQTLEMRDFIVFHALDHVDLMELTRPVMVLRTELMAPEMTDLMPFHTEEAMLRIARSEEHTSELQSRGHLVCRLLLEKTT